MKSQLEKYKESMTKQALRFIPFEDSEKFAVTKIIRDATNDMELMLRVSIQLGEYKRLVQIEKKYISEIQKSTSQKLREIAEIMDDDI